MDGIKDLVNSAEKVPLVPLHASASYHNALTEMTAFVDKTLTDNPAIHDLIGHNPLQMMYDNHKHHAAFMAAVFSIGSHSLLAKTLPWVYRAYHGHNFSFDYFPLELKAWVAAAEKFLPAEDSQSVVAVYQWMIESHELTIQLAATAEIAEMPVAMDWLEQKNGFRTALLNGDHRACLDISAKLVQSSADIEAFYLQIIQPVLYEVGMLWEKAEISVAQEHLASAITSRVMASVNLHITPPKISPGRAVVAASPNEFHEIGPAMISDLLENDGWKVTYLGANVPHTDLLDFLRNNTPELLVLSVTIAFNLDKARDIIEEMKTDPQLKKISIIVGGRVFNDNPELWHRVGADAFATNAAEVSQLARQLRKNHVN